MCEVEGKMPHINKCDAMGFVTDNSAGKAGETATGRENYRV